MVEVEKDVPTEKSAGNGRLLEKKEDNREGSTTYYHKDGKRAEDR